MRKVLFFILAVLLSVGSGWADATKLSTVTAVTSGNYYVFNTHNQQDSYTKYYLYDNNGAVNAIELNSLDDYKKIIWKVVVKDEANKLYTFQNVATNKYLTIPSTNNNNGSVTTSTDEVSMYMGIGNDNVGMYLRNTESTGEDGIQYIDASYNGNYIVSWQGSDPASSSKLLQMYEIGSTYEDFAYFFSNALEAITTPEAGLYKVTSGHTFEMETSGGDVFDFYSLKQSANLSVTRNQEMSLSDIAILKISTIKEEQLPFSLTTITNGVFAESTKWYYLKQGTNYIRYDNNAEAKSSYVTSKEVDSKYLWCFVKDANYPYIYIYNKAAGASIALREQLSDNENYASFHNQGYCTFLNTDREMPLYIRSNTSNDGTYTFQLAADDVSGTCILGKHVGSNLSIWGNGANVNNGASSFAFEEADVLPAVVKYTLTDTVGTIYTGTASCVGNDRIILTGAEGATFTNETWTDNGNGTYNYSATISFDFPVSSATKKNYTYIGVASSDQRLLFADTVNAGAYNVKCNYNENTYNNMTSVTTKAFEWAIYPSCTNGVFTFTIQNRYADENRLAEKYINLTSGSQNDLCPLSDTGYGYAYDYCVGTAKGFHLPGTNNFISINSPGGSDQNLFVWGKGDGATHQGSNLAFFTPINFSALVGELFKPYSAAAFFNNPVIGDGVGKYTQSESYAEPESYTAYKKAVAKAEQIVMAQDISSYTYSDFTTTKSTLTNFNISDVINAGLTLNMPSPGKFYRFYGFGHMLRDGYPYYMTAGAAGERLTYSEDDGNRSIFYLTEDNNLLAYYNGLFCNAATMSAVGGDKGVYTIDATPANIIANEERGVKSTGTYRIKHGTNYLVDWANNGNIQDNCSDANNNWIGWKIEEVTELPVTIPSITGGLATLYAPVALTLPANVYAYVATLSEGGSRLSLTKISGSVIPANTGVLLRSMETLSENKVYNFGISSTAGESVTSVLTGDIATKEMASGKNYYSLQTNNSTDAGFYKKEKGNLSGFKAYLTTATGSNGFVFSFADDDLTGVAEIPQSTLNDNVYRDILGRKVENPVKGQIYIVNGRTVRF